MHKDGVNCAVSSRINSHCGPDSLVQEEKRRGKKTHIYPYFTDIGENKARIRMQNASLAVLFIVYLMCLS